MPRKTTSPPSPLHQVERGDKPAIPITYSRRKTLAVLVFPDGRVEVRAPIGCDRSRIEGFIRLKSAWIARTAARKRQQAAERAASAPPTRTYQAGEQFPILGDCLTLALVRGDRAGVRLENGQLVVTTPSPGDGAEVARLLRRWIEREAARVFRQRLEAIAAHASAFGVPPSSALTLRRMKSRWGSCSSRGRITLNLKLITLAPDLLDYVIAHELCHLVEMNHSPHYYALLDRVRPGWRPERARLKAVVASSQDWP